MARAYKCDICKTLFDPEDYPNDVYFAADIAYLSQGTVLRPMNHKKYFEKFVCCKDCTKKIFDTSKKESDSNEKDSERFANIDFIDIISNISKRIDEYGRQLYESVCKGKTPERKSGTEQKSGD